MASAYKCDVCGTLFTRDIIPDVRLIIYRRGYGDFRQDLCPKCQKELEDWCNKKENKK